MKFEQFRNEIKSIYAEKFSKSYCNVKIYNGLGKSITITLHMSASNDECAHGIVQNDMIQAMFDIVLPKDWKENDELPEQMTMMAINRDIKTKPAIDYMYCGYRNVSFRKVSGDAEKMIQSFQKFVGRLFDAVMEEYESDNLLDFDRDLVKEKYFS